MASRPAEAKWTPGPWAITGQYGVNKAEISGNTRDRGTCAIATVWNKTDQRNRETGKFEPKSWVEGEANARLIAAAPDLHEALAEAIRNGERDGPGAAMAILNTLGRAALAKAEGREP